MSQQASSVATSETFFGLSRESALVYHWFNNARHASQRCAPWRASFLCGTFPHRTKCLQSLQDEVTRSHETFIKHYHDTYTSPALPPIWAVCEVLTLGQLSQWLDNLKRRSDRQAIAQALGFDEVVICAFAHHLATVRNLCAHHSRVWNRKFTIRMKLPHRPSHVTPWFNAQEDHKVYNTLLMLALLLERVCPDSTWTSRLIRLIDGMPVGTTQAMGFPENWRDFPVWAKAHKEIPHDPILD